MTYIRFFFILYWFVLFLKFGPLPSENPRCAPIYADHTTFYSKCVEASDLWQQLELAFEIESDL